MEEIDASGNIADIVLKEGEALLFGDSTFE